MGLVDFVDDQKFVDDQGLVDDRDTVDFVENLVVLVVVDAVVNVGVRHLRVVVAMSGSLAETSFGLQLHVSLVEKLEVGKMSFATVVVVSDEIVVLFDVVADFVVLFDVVADFVVEFDVVADVVVASDVVADVVFAFDVVADVVVAFDVVALTVDFDVYLPCLSCHWLAFFCNSKISVLFAHCQSAV